MYAIAPCWDDYILESIHDVNVIDLIDWFAVPMDQQQGVLQLLQLTAGAFSLASYPNIYIDFFCLVDWC